MAFGDGSIGTQSGIGQGLAYILPQTKSEHYALQMAQDESKQIAAQAAAKIKRQQQLSDGLDKQFAAQKLPAFWSPYNKIVSDNSASWQKKAADYSATTGKSPFTNPDLMNEYNTNVNGVAQQSKDLGAKYSKLYGAAVADAGNKYTLESVKQVLDAEKDIQANPMDYINGKKSIPELKTSPADFEDFTKLIKPVSVTNKNGYMDTVRASRPDNIDQAYNTLMANPEKWGPMVLDNFGFDVTKPSYPVIGKGGRKVYPTNETALKAVADRLLASDNAEGELAIYGINKADEFVEEKLIDAMKKQNQGIGKFLTQSADLADSKVNKSTAVSYDAQNNARANARMDKEAKGDKGDETVIYRQNWVNDIWNKVPGSGEKLKAAVSANPDYSEPLKVNMNDGNLSFVIPGKVISKNVDGKDKTEITAGRTVTIRPDDAGAKTKINALLSELTGENITESKFQSGNAGGKVKPNQSTPQKNKPTKKNDPLGIF